ncbi:MAG: OB-fold nucleic acid binding domain-containing protein [Candidatus Woesearchaeota archaeon]
MENKSPLIRQTAVKITLGEVAQGRYVQEEDALNYLLTFDQRQIYRLNVVGIIVHLQKQGNITNLWLEDGTGKLIVRFFEENKILKELNPGDIVLVVGRLRQYNQEKYLSSEIVKKVDASWLKLRKEELKEKFALILETKPLEEVISAALPEVKPLSLPTEEEIIEEEVIDDTKEILPTQKILLIIKEKDKGEGVLVEEILHCSFLNDTEKLIEKMLEKGDIFQNLPGRVKVL